MNRLNPLDSVEDLLIANDWVYKRLTTQELLLQITGNACDYCLNFSWNGHLNILNITCQLEDYIPEGKLGEAMLIANELSQSLKLGHFSVDHKKRAMTHKYSLALCKEDEMINRAYIANIVEMILQDCEDNSPLFQCFLNKDLNGEDKKSISLLIMPVKGNA